MSRRSDDRVIFEITESENSAYRIVEKFDEDMRMDFLKGDTFNPALNPDIDPKQLAREERAFETKVEEEGTYGYVLEAWNPKVGMGWEHIDSCWGFVGRYVEGDAEHEHYYVQELREQIKKMMKNQKRVG